MSIPEVGDRITISTLPGCDIDLTIDAVEQRSGETVITKATVHRVNIKPPMLNLPKLPSGWTDASQP